MLFKASHVSWITKRSVPLSNNIKNDNTSQVCFVQRSSSISDRYRSAFAIYRLNSMDASQSRGTISVCFLLLWVVFAVCVAVFTGARPQDH